MCGITGFNWKNEKLITNITDLLIHRGPDQSGVFCDENISLGHRRLSILDLSPKGIQPMTNEDGTVLLVFNGEIFNYQDIREELINKGHNFRSSTDTEVIVHLYEEEGPEMVRRLNGQFAFALYDKKTGRLMLARDRVGILPLFYYMRGGKFIFGSELKTILSAGIEKEIDQDALVFYLRFGFISAPLCIVKDAYKLKPGHYLIYGLKEKKILAYNSYWEIDFREDISDVKKAESVIRQGLRKATSLRLMADVPVGAFLSGGVDSSAVVATIIGERKKLKTFSVKFEYKEYDESNYAKLVARHLNTDHHEIVLKPDAIREIIPELVEHYDEPTGDSSAIPTYFVSKFARQYVTVCLSGDGGDEILAGYERYRYFLVLKFLNSLPAWIRRILRWGISALLKIKPDFGFEKVRELLLLGKMNDINLYEKLVEKIGSTDIEKLLKRKVVYRDTTLQVKEKAGINAAQNYDIVHYLEGDILTKVDRAAMAVSLETRPPFLDHNFIELCLRMKLDLRQKGFTGKWILKRAFRNILPAAVIKRSKKGFGVPIKYYLKNELYDLVEKYVFNYKGHSLFDNEFLKSMSSGKSPRDTYRLYWNILMFNMWHERWIKQN